MTRRRALITGVTGQDGSYLAEFLIGQGYEVHGLKRRSSVFNTSRIDHIYQDPHDEPPDLILHYGDLVDSTNISRLVGEIKPDEIYNLGAQSHVAVSFDTPEYTSEVNALGTLRILEAIRLHGLESKSRFYQASSSEMFGDSEISPQNERTPLRPRSPYATAKLFAYWTTINYRESYGIYACNGLLFNHESPRRGETFVTRKVTRGLANIALGVDDCLYLGNLDAMRDWGHARDYVRMMWLMLQQAEPDDYVIATGEQMSVRDFLSLAANDIGVTLEFDGEGLEEVATVAHKVGDRAPAINVGDVIVQVDPRYYRPLDVGSLMGDATKAARQLGWQVEVSVEALCSEMMQADLKEARFAQERAKLDAER